MTDAGNARWGAVLALVKMRLRLFYREPGTMFWTFGFPMVMSVVLGIAFRSSKPEPVACDIIEAPTAAAMASELEGQRLEGQPMVRTRVVPEATALRELRGGKVAVVIEPGPPITFRFDPTRPEGLSGRATVRDALERARGREDRLTVASREVTEPGARYIDFLVPGLVGLGLMSTGFWGIGFSLAEMRTKKLLKRLVATPMHRSDFLASFVLTRALLLFVELPPILVFSRLVFGVQVHGSYAALALVALAGGLTFAAMGLMLACRSENPQIVTGLINLASFPMYLCSGVFFSADRFPKGLQPIIHALPLTALNDALRAIMNEGGSLGSVWQHLVVLVVWGLASFALALRLFRWR